MNNQNNDYRSQEELTNQILMRDFNKKINNNNQNIKNNNNLYNKNGDNNINHNNINIKINNNFAQPKKLPYGGKTPFSQINKDYQEDDEYNNEKNDVDMNFKDNCGENFFKKQKSNVEKDPMIWEDKEKS